MTLFPDWDSGARHPDLDPPLSADARRTGRQRAQLAGGRHPATRVELLDPGWDYHCRGCAHAFRIDHGGRRHWWKCELHRLGPSRSAASDIRVGWPACRLFRIDADAS